MADTSALPADYICRVCRAEGTSDKPLHYPCLCTGSIKYIHQECLVQWLKYSRKEYCELCHHRFSFMPIYSPDMPKRLPFRDLFSGLLTTVGKVVRNWLHYTLVAFAWLGVVPLTACRMYQCLFTGSVTSFLMFPLDMLSGDNLVSDCLHGCLIVTCTLCAFISLVWLREQIMHGGGPDWLEQDIPGQNQPGQPVDPQADVVENENDSDNDAEDNGEDDQNEPNANNDVGEGAQDEANWNPIEWDRAAEELTWERLLGLDGSLAFLEHVFWVVSLNTLFILVFTFCPYHVGHHLIVGLKLDEYVSSAQFGGLSTTFCGYIAFGIAFIMLQAIAAMLKFKKAKRFLGICYIIIKVALLTICEIGIFPLICGLWLDICSLPLLQATLQNRKENFLAAPGTSLFLHWLIGMVFVFYFSSFIVLLREVLRPGLLWFLRNVNDPDFNPIQEMIHRPIFSHLRQFITSSLLFGTSILLLLRLPLWIISVLFPKFLPYSISLSTDTPVSELSLELLLLQVIIPALLEHGHIRQWLRNVIKAWCIGVSYFLSLRSYLLGDVALAEQAVDNQAQGNGNRPAANNNERIEVIPNPQVVGDVFARGGGLRAAHHALLHGPVRAGNYSYHKPKFFTFRVFVACILMCVTLVFCSLLFLTVPVGIGRFAMRLWMADQDVQVHELYTGACGLYICWLCTRLITIVLCWVPEGYNVILEKVKFWSLIGLKCVVVICFLLGLVPVLVGLLFELVVFVPLRVSRHQSPLYFVWQDWVLGILYVKIICAATMMGPKCWLKDAVDQIYQNGLRQMSLTFIMKKLIIPVIVLLGLALSVPYVIANSLVPLLGVPFTVRNQISRQIYPTLASFILLACIVNFQIRQFSKLYEHIKNDKYLVGRRLVNYEHRKQQNQSSREGS